MTLKEVEARLDALCTEIQLSGLADYDNPENYKATLIVTALDKVNDELVRGEA